jgi:glyoxylase-like metal-dependent hydrolase (beta-lactamase superfamily II)
MKTWDTRNGYRIARVLAGRSNVFLVAHGGKSILVDTSPGSCWRKLQRGLRRMGVGRIDALVLTHSHYDHAGNAARVREKYGARVILHRSEAPFLASGENVVPRGTNRLGRLLIDHLGKKFARSVRCAPCRADVLVDERLSLEDYGFNAYLLHTPGHSPGSISMIVDDEVALVGDAMFGVAPWSVFPPFAAATGQLVESWGKLLATNCRLFLPAHGTANRRALVQKDFDRRKIGKRGVASISGVKGT